MKTWRFTFKCEYFGSQTELPFSVDADTYHDATILADAYVKEKFPIECEQDLARIKFEGLGIVPKDWGKSKRELQEPCEYCVNECQGKNIIEDEETSLEVYLDFGYLTAQTEAGDASGGEYTQMLGTIINYCPMCGRKLEDSHERD